MARSRAEILKSKATNARQTMRRRSAPDAFVPGAPAILEWLSAQPMVCAYSGEKITPATMQIDHRTPLERGGTNHFTNLALTSAASNRAKGTMDEAEYRALLALLATFQDGGKDVLRRLKAAALVYR